MTQSNISGEADIGDGAFPLDDGAALIPPFSGPVKHSGRRGALARGAGAVDLGAKLLYQSPQSNGGEAAMATVVVTEFMDEGALAPLIERCAVLYEPTLVDDRPKLLGALGVCEALIVRNRTQVTPELLDAAPRLKIVGRLGVGLDNIDQDACAARGIAVAAATGANTVSVAEYVVTTALMLLRGAYAANAEMIAGAWPRNALVGGEAQGKQIGLYGFGGVAQAVARRARAFDMTVAAHDPFLPEDDPAWAGVRRCDAAELLASCDLLSLHLPLTTDTAGLIGAAAIARMKPGAILINTARGGVVDAAAVAAALRSGALGGAALDVFETEPLGGAEAAVFEGAPNLILTPHIAGVTREANIRVSAITVANVRKALFGDA